MRELFSVLALFATYVVYNRFVTIPAGLALHMRPGLIFLIVFVMDMVQVPLLLRLYEKGTRWVLLKRLNLEARAEGAVSGGRLGRWAQRLGAPGVALLASMPGVGGGMWSAVLFSHILGLNRKKSYFYLTTGSFVGCFAMTFAGKAGIDLILWIRDLLLGHA